MEDFIINQFRAHRNYVDSFKKSPSFGSVEYYHPKTNKRITINEMNGMLNRDAIKHANNIAKHKEKFYPKLFGK